MLYLNPFRTKMSNHTKNEQSSHNPWCRNSPQNDGFLQGTRGLWGEPWPLTQPQPMILNRARRFFLSPAGLNCTCATFSLPSLIAEVKNIIILHVSYHLNVRDNLRRFYLSCLPPRQFGDGVTSPARTTDGHRPNLRKSDLRKRK